MPADRMRWSQWLFVLAIGACQSQDRPITTAWADPSPHEVRFITVAPGVALEVLDWGGSGPPLIFLSGLQDVAHGFDDLAPEFTDRHHVLAITRRGYGASSQSAGGYDLPTRVADLRTVLDSLHLDRVALVGHSIAGDELTAFAGDFPQRVTRLVYLDAAYDHSGVATLLADYPEPPPMLPADSASPAAVQAYTLRTFGMHIPVAQLRAIGRYDATGHLTANVTPAAIDAQMLAGCGHPDYKAVRAPALVLDAVADSAPELFPTWTAMDSSSRNRATRFVTTLQRWAGEQRAIVRRDLPSAEVIELHGANHYVFDSHRAPVIAAMQRFLAAP